MTLSMRQLERIGVYSIKCAQCCIAIMVRPCEASRKYCSQACYGLANRHNSRCAHCNARTKRAGQKYCSSVCCGLATRKRVAGVCRNCGIALESHPYKERFFCSKSCASSANAKTGKIGHPFFAKAYSKKRRAGWIHGSRTTEANRAHGMVLAAVRNGRLLRPTTCEKCGCDCIPHGHHDDYARPLDVRWWCPGCHARFHLIHGDSQDIMATGHDANG